MGVWAMDISHWYRALHALQSIEDFHLSELSLHPLADYIDVISVRHWRSQLSFYAQTTFPGITSKPLSLAMQGLGGKLNYKIMLLNDNIFNLTSLIVITLLGLWSEELTATLTVLAYSLQIYQEASNLNLKPSEHLRRQLKDRKHYATQNSLPTWQNRTITQSARLAKGRFS